MGHMAVFDLFGTGVRQGNSGNRNLVSGAVHPRRRLPNATIMGKFSFVVAVHMIVHDFIPFWCRSQSILIDKSCL